MFTASPFASSAKPTAQSPPQRPAAASLPREGQTGFGLGWLVQWVPSHCSIIVFDTDALVDVPTAVQLVGDVHDTPDSAPVAPAGTGLEPRDQVFPFQWAADDFCTPADVK